VVDHSRSRSPVARSRQPSSEHSPVARGLSEPVARSLEYWAATRGGKPALFEGEAFLTYREWNEYADMLAEAFAGRGLGLDDVIALRCHNRIEWAVIALACAKIDARLLTLDTDISPQMLRDRLIAGRATALIVGDIAPSRLAGSLHGLPLKLKASMDGACPTFFNFWDLFPPVAPPRFGAAQPFLMAWTAQADTAALPVGVPRRRAAPASLAPPPVPDFGASLITIPVHRTWGAMQFWAALIAGRSIVMMREFEPVAALDVIARRRVTHWCALPDTLAQIQHLGLDTSRDTRTLRELVVGGAQASPELKAWLNDSFGGILNDAYGSPETGVIAWMSPQERAGRLDSCGRPLRGVSVEVRDASGRQLPRGMTGQIWARTPRSLECELPGSSHDHRRDAEGFVATGDAGLIDTDGYIYLTGRADPGCEMRRAG
jgi:acyl-coenzyme A synthetase/AMP-(fatty) acid ligase